MNPVEIMENRNMKVALFGTCRLRSIREHFSCTDFDEAISYVHSTKEIIQLIKYITKQIEIPASVSQFCFRRGILNRQPLAYSEQFVQQFNEADLFVIEICAMKKYLYQGHYLHHLAVDKRLHYYKDTTRQVLENTVVQYQDRQEIEKDISEIVDLVHPGKILIVSHINATIDASEQQPSSSRVNNIIAGMARRARSLIRPELPEDPAAPQVAAIGKRTELILLLRDIAQEKRIAFFDPTVVLSQYDQNRVLVSESPGQPPGHYTDFGDQVMGPLYADEIRRIMEGQ